MTGRPSPSGGREVGLRLSIDVSAVPGEPGGAGRYVIELVRALGGLAGGAGADPQGAPWRCVLACRRGDGARWEPVAGNGRMSVTAVAPKTRPGRLLWERARMGSWLDRMRVDVHHGPHYTMPGRCRAARVVTVHDLTFVEHPEWHDPVKARFFATAIRRAARDADVVICVSEATAARLHATHHVSGEVVVIPHGVDTARFRPDAPDAAADERVRERHGLADPYVLFLGTIEPRKNVRTLVEAFGRLVPGGRVPGGMRLVLAGAFGWGPDPVAEAGVREAVARRIVRLGRVDDEDVAALLRGAACVAYPSFEEGFGLPALEALACGAPLVSVAGTVMAGMAAGAAWCAAASDAGPLADAIEAACTAPVAEAARRRAVGLEISARHTWEGAARAHLDAYRTAWERHRSREG